MGLLTVKAPFNVPKFKVFPYLLSNFNDRVIHLKFSLSLVFKSTAPKRHLDASFTVKACCICSVPYF